MKCFLKRHPRLSVRVANMTKRSRTAVLHKEINDFFDLLEKVAEAPYEGRCWDKEGLCGEGSEECGTG
jgi:hypothetical protein